MLPATPVRNQCNRSVTKTFPASEAKVTELQVRLKAGLVKKSSASPTT